jgi:hypothetical protein
MDLISKFYDPEFAIGQNHFRRGLKLNKLKLDFFITPTSLPKVPIKKRLLIHRSSIALPRFHMLP